MISAAVANDGIVMNPTVVSRVTGADLAPLSTFQPSPFGRAMSANTAAKLRQMMIDNVQEGAAYGARIDGVAVAGKTGTAQNGPGQPWTLWFTGFAPANQPKYALGVLIQNDGGQTNVDSGLIAAPVAKKVLEAVLKQ